MPTRRASSTLVIRPSSCNSSRIWRSMASRRAGTESSRGWPLLAQLLATARDTREILLLAGIWPPAAPFGFHKLVVPGLHILHSCREVINCAEHQCAFRPIPCAPRDRSVTAGRSDGAYRKTTPPARFADALGLPRSRGLRGWAR